MRAVAVDLTKLRGKKIFIRVVDESSGAWGHINFDDFCFHDKQPAAIQPPCRVSPVLQHLKPNPGDDPTDSGIRVPEGFRVDLIAREPEVTQPIAFTFDARGRLWVVEAHSYPQRQPIGEGRDRVVIFEDADADGTFETRKVFAENLNLVSGIEVGFGGVWLGAAPHLLFIPDRDGDDVPDARSEVLLDGWGYQDTHETPNSLTWGPDGWLYGNHGVFNKSFVANPARQPMSESGFMPVSGVIIRCVTSSRFLRVAAATSGGSTSTTTGISSSRIAAVSGGVGRLRSSCTAGITGIR
jgi:hypothetical protein